MSNSNEDWQRISSSAIGILFFKHLIAFVRANFIGLIPLFYAAFKQGEKEFIYYSFGGLSVLMLLVLIYAILYFLNFKYRLADHGILVRKGVFSKEKIDLSYDRVQNVAIHHPFYFRPLHLVTLTLDSAGSHKSEIHLIGVSETLAQLVRSKIDLSREQASTETSEEASTAELTEEQKQPTWEYRIPLGDIVRYGISNLSILLWGLALASVAPNSVNYDWIADYISTGKEYFENLNLGIGLLITATVLLMIFLILTLMVLSIAAGIYRYYDYRFSDEGQKIKKISGLFNRKEMSLLKSKVQLISFRQNFIRRQFKGYTIKLLQVNQKEEDSNPLGSFMVPFVPISLRDHFGELIFPKYSSTQGEFQRMALPYFLRLSVMWSSIISIPILALSLASPYFLWLLIGILPVCYLSYRWYSNYGFRTDGEYLVLQFGFFGKSMNLFPIDKVLRTTIVETPLLRRRQLNHLKLKLPSKTIVLPYLPKAIAQPLANYILFKVESSIGKHL